MPRKNEAGLCKADLVKRTAARLRNSGYRRCVYLPTQTLHVSDDYGNSRNFVVRREPKEIYLIEEDVRQVISELLTVVEEALANGEKMTILGFGELKLKYRPPRTTYLPGTNEQVLVSGRYSPKFTFGERLRRAARLFEMKLNGSCGNMFDEDDPSLNEPNQKDNEVE